MVVRAGIKLSTYEIYEIFYIKLSIVKPIHNTFFPSDGAKSALKARTFLFHRIKEASEETLLPIEEYLLWSDNAKTVREKHEKMDDTLLDAFKAFKKRKGVNGEEPDPKRIHSV
eukprot:m.46526 g.46526  ORF g.46526 m.46526 type:complete len:114 (+) comp10383_c0_seq1:1041-1382(+)